MHMYSDPAEMLEREHRIAAGLERRRILRILEWIASLEGDRAAALHPPGATLTERLRAFVSKDPEHKMVDDRSAVLREAIQTIRDRSGPLPEEGRENEPRILIMPEVRRGEKTNMATYIIRPTESGFEWFPGVQPEVSEEMGLTQRWSQRSATMSDIYDTNLKLVVGREQLVESNLARASEFAWKQMWDWDNLFKGQMYRQTEAVNAVTQQALANMTGLANVVGYTASEKLLESAGAIASEQIERAISSQVNPDAIASAVAGKVLDKLAE